MITDSLKAKAIAQLKLGYPYRDVANQFELPEALVKSWFNSLDVNDLTSLAANIHAIGVVSDSKVTPGNVDVLRDKIEKVAIKVIDQAEVYVAYPDIVQAKALNLLADTCAKLYLSIVSKAGSAAIPTKTASLLEQLGKD